jgi:NO-binding membrane sensor protein with MHYT domain
MFDTFQGLVLLALWAVTFAVKAFAFVDCIRRPKEAFPAVGRQSKVLWLILTGLAAGAGVFPGFTLNIIGLAGVVVALVYVFDVRVKIIDITSRRW